MAVETNARIEFSVSSVEEWERVNPKLHQGEPVFAKKPSGKYILKVGAPGGSTYKNAVVVWDQDDAETKMENTQTAAAEALASKNAAAASASAAKTSETAAAGSKSAAATSAENAKTSETNAAASKTAAANSASTASAKATASANSAIAAATSEKNAAAASSAAATSESNALKSASAASTSAGNARTSETNASTSASNAANSAKAAKASADRAATFDPTSYYTKAETYTQAEVDNKIKNNKPDLSSYYTKTEVDAKVPTKTSQLTNDSGFVTKDDAPSVDISSGEAVKSSVVSFTGTGTVGWKRIGDIVVLYIKGEIKKISVGYHATILFGKFPPPITQVYGTLSYNTDYYNTVQIRLDANGNLWSVGDSDDYVDFNNNVYNISLTYIAK